MTYAGFLLVFVLLPLVVVLWRHGATPRGRGWIPLGALLAIVYVLACAGPVLAFQLVLLRRRHGRETPAVLRAVVPPALLVGVWLVATDHVAIAEGIWRFDDRLHLGWRIGMVPIEELLFFVATNLLVVFGLALLDGLGMRA